jgi:hypothetical protein
MKLLLILMLASVVSAQTATTNWQHQFGGSNKALFTGSKTLINQQSYGDIMNRLRLGYDAKYKDWFQVHFDYDNEFHAGNLITEPEFDLVRRRQEPAWWDLHRIVTDQDHFYWDTSLYRAYASFRSATTTLTVGRQRIGWGTARFWSPADVFNPLNPLQIEASQRQGVDGGYFEWAVSSNLTWSTALLPQNHWQASTVATRLATSISGYDLAAFVGEFADDWSAGAEMAGQLGGAGLRGELTYRWRDESIRMNNPLRVTFGADYAFPNTLYIVGEYFYNQGQPALTPDFDPASLFIFTSEIFTRQRHFLSTGATYEITPLFKIEGYSIWDMAGGSLFLMPQVRYNLAANIDLAAGAQFFTGDEASEFGVLNHTFFAEFQVHF